MDMHQQALPGVEVITVTAVSPSGLGRYRHCPRLYRFLHVDGLWQYSRTSGRQSFGTSIHAALRDFYRQAPARRTLKGLLDMFKAAWVKEGYASREERARERERGLEVLRGWYGRADVGLVPHATEVGLQATWGEITLKGRIDRIDRVPDGLRVVDYKTGMRPLDQEAADVDPALTIYAALVERRLGRPVASLALDYVVPGVQVETARPDLGGRLDEVLASARELRNDREFPPNTGPWCARCDLLARCAEGQAEVAAHEQP